MSMQVRESFSAVPMSATGVVSGVNSQGGGGALGVIFCSSSNGASLTIYDADTADTSKKIVDTFPIIAGQTYALPFRVSKGVYIVLSGGTASWTVGVGAN
jgi:FtsP/CotA-like multicopper oxidase with cupredoxin domain